MQMNQLVILFIVLLMTPLLGCTNTPISPIVKSAVINYCGLLSDDERRLWRIQWDKELAPYKVRAICPAKGDNDMGNKTSKSDIGKDVDQVATHNCDPITDPNCQPHPIPGCDPITGECNHRTIEEVNRIVIKASMEPLYITESKIGGHVNIGSVTWPYLHTRHNSTLIPLYIGEAATVSLKYIDGKHPFYYGFTPGANRSDAFGMQVGAEMINEIPMVEVGEHLVMTLAGPKLIGAITDTEIWSELFSDHPTIHLLVKPFNAGMFTA